MDKISCLWQPLSFYGVVVGIVHSTHGGKPNWYALAIIIVLQRKVPRSAGNL